MSNDKAVSTEDLCSDSNELLRNHNNALGVLRLEAILNTLVENKVESLKNEGRRSFSVTSSPKKLIEKFKSPKHTVENEKSKDNIRKKHQFKRHVLQQEISISSPDSHSQLKSNENSQKLTTGHYDACAYASCHSLPESTRYYEDFKFKLENNHDIETDEILAQELMRKMKRKRRRRRKKRMKKSLGMHQHAIHQEISLDRETLKHYEADELPPRAKWTIVATACLLLFMCLLLVGITLRMAPLIDEIVREENEKLLNSISNPGNSSFTVHNLT